MNIESKIQPQKRRRGLKKPKISLSAFLEDEDATKKDTEADPATSWWKDLYKKPAAGHLGVHHAPNSDGLFQDSLASGSVFFGENSTSHPNQPGRSGPSKVRRRSVRLIINQHQNELNDNAEPQSETPAVKWPTASTVTPVNHTTIATSKDIQRIAKNIDIQDDPLHSKKMKPQKRRRSSSGNIFARKRTIGYAKSDESPMVDMPSN